MSQYCKKIFVANRDEVDENPEIEVENSPEDLPTPNDRRENAQRHWRNLPAWQKEDPWFSAILAGLAYEPLPMPYRNNLAAELRSKEMTQGYFVDRYLLYKRGEGRDAQICIPRQLVKAVMEQCHSAPSAAHLGFRKSYHRLTSKYFWTSMYWEMETFVDNCPYCILRKEEPHNAKERFGGR